MAKQPLVILAELLLVLEVAAPTGSAPLSPATSLLSVVRLYKCAAGTFCPQGSLYFFSIADCGATGSTATGGWTLGKEADSGATAVAGKLLAA